MLTKLIRTQTAKQEAQLENWLKTRTETIPFPADVRLYENLDYMGDGQMLCSARNIRSVRMQPFLPFSARYSLPSTKSARQLRNTAVIRQGYISAATVPGHGCAYILPQWKPARSLPMPPRCKQ